MTLSSLFRFSGLLAFAGLLGIAPALADVSHVRVVRLSVAEGDVRFTRDTKGKDPLTDPGAQWETAPLNLPIRQGYTIATGNGRAEIEFESGAGVPQQQYGARVLRSFPRGRGKDDQADFAPGVRGVLCEPDRRRLLQRHRRGFQRRSGGQIAVPREQF